MKKLADIRRQYACAALQSMNLAECYQINAIVANSWEIADAMLAHEEQHPLPDTLQIKQNNPYQVVLEQRLAEITKRDSPASTVAEINTELLEACIAFLDWCENDPGNIAPLAELIAPQLHEAIEKAKHQLNNPAQVTFVDSEGEPYGKETES